MKILKNAQIFVNSIINDEEDYAYAIGKYKNVDKKLSYAIAVRSYEDRRARMRHFRDHQIFREPAWDLLLDLFIRQTRGEQVSVKAAAIASGVPATTALRWLKALEDGKLISIEGDNKDGRRKSIRLTPSGYEIMEHYLVEIGAAWNSMLVRD